MESEPIILTNSNGHTLAEHVRQSVDEYFKHLNGHDFSGLYQLVMTEVEKPLLETALKHADFNQCRAAKVLGMSRSTLRKKLELHKLV